jgi:predicted GNAT superfamily acetyltransferase
MPLDLDDHARSSQTTDYGTDAAGFSYRAFTSPEDGAACVALQSEIWGGAFDHVPASLLRVVTSIGGLAIGAFDPDGTLVGFVFSLAGIRDGEPIHWSHMLGVRESVRGSGVGRALRAAAP